MDLLITRIQQYLQTGWMCVPFGIRQILKWILLYPYLVLHHTRIVINSETPSVRPSAQPIHPPQDANYHKIQNFPLPNTGPEQREAFLFYDIFARDKQLFVLFVKEDHQTLALCNEDIHITVDQQTLTYKETIAGQAHVYISIYTFDYPFTEHRVRVSCKGINKDFTLSHIRSKQVGLLLHSTLFKDDHFLLPMFYDYYTKQGIDSFVWYYNGVWESDLQQKYPFGDDVIILSWAYPYTKPVSRFTGQNTQLLHALYKYGKSSYEYISLFDLDEYVKIKHTNLRSYILQNPGYVAYIFLNCWTWVLRLRGEHQPKVRQRLPKVLLRAKKPTYQAASLMIDNKKFYYFLRCKIVHRTNRTETIITHAVFPSSDDVAKGRGMLVKQSSMFLHITNFRKGHSQKMLKRFSDFLRPAYLSKWKI